MSRIKDEKIKQGYVASPVRETCRNCKHVATYGHYNEKLSCKLGEFSVKANATCDLFLPYE